MPTETYNPIDEKVEAGHGAYVSAEEAENNAANTTQDQIDNLHSDTSASDMEKSGASGEPNQFLYTGSGKQAQLSMIKRIGVLLTSKGGIGALVSTIGIGGTIMMGGFLFPSGLTIGALAQAIDTNDASSIAYDVRFKHTLRNMTKTDGGEEICNNKKSIKCKMGKISNKALHRLNKWGVTAVFDADAGGNSGTRYDGTTKRGYPKKNPTHYEFDVDGNKRLVAANNLVDFLLEPGNQKYANKILGISGAFNMRIQAWVGKHITQKLYNKFNLRRAGGLADGSNKILKNTKEQVDEMFKKLKTKIPAAASVDDSVNKIKAAIEKDVKFSKKGGAAYLIAVGGCIVVKAPGYIATAQAAIQLGQLLTVAMDLFLSPISKQKASGLEPANSITSEDSSALGSMFTERVPNATGALKSATDSSIFLSAIGVNTGRPNVPTNLAPGFSILSSDIVAAAAKGAELTEPACNVVLSPAAMYLAMAADIQLTIASSATIIGGIIKVAASWALAEITGAIINEVAGEMARETLTNLAKNDAIPNARGEELGDVLGLSLMSFFSAGGAANHLSWLSTDQLQDFVGIKQENQQFHRQMDIASLSPFDTSSKYTFLGSIVHNMRMAVIANGGYGGGIGGIISSLGRLPSLITTNSSAATSQFSANYCSYAKDYRLEPSEGSSVALLASGLPCVGMTRAEANMSTERAIQLATSEGWICNPETTNDCPDIEEGATIDDLMPKGDPEAPVGGVIRPDNLLYQRVLSCSDVSDGKYLMVANGCVTRPSSGSGLGDIDACQYLESDETNNKARREFCENNNATVEGVKNPEAVSAMLPLLVDFTLSQIINGNNDNVEPPKKGIGSPPSKDNTGACDERTIDMGIYENAHNKGEQTPVRLCAVPNLPAAGYTGSPYYSSIKAVDPSQQAEATGKALVNTRASGATYEMVQAAAADGVSLTLGSYFAFRSYEHQVHLRNSWCAKGKCGNAALPGHSNHEMGLAIDFSLPGRPHSAIRQASSQLRWLRANASKFKFNETVPSEDWHWEYTNIKDGN